MEINYLDTGDTGHAISADSDGALFAGIIGSEKYVLKNGSQFNAEVQSNNIVKISDGDLVMYGRHVRIPANDSALVTINNGHSGTNRIDLIAFRYTKDSTGKETVDLVVIQGEDSTGTPTAPTAIDGNILIGAMQSDFPLYAVTLNGINITKVEKLFKTVETNDTLTQKVNELNSTIGTIKTAISPTMGENTNSTRVVSLLNGSIKIAGISKVATMTRNYIKVTDVAEVCKLFDIPSVDPKQITVISYNGDWDANKGNFFAPSYQNNTWWQYSDTSVSGATSTRLNIFIIYIA